MHALVYFVTDITINLLEMQERSWEKKILWAEHLTEMGTQFGMKTTWQNLGCRKLKWGYNKAD